MTKIVEKSIAEIIIIGLITIVFLSSCGNTKEMKDCCKKTAQEVYEYEGWTIDHAN